MGDDAVIRETSRTLETLDQIEKDARRCGRKVLAEAARESYLTLREGYQRSRSEERPRLPSES